MQDLSVYPASNMHVQSCCETRTHTHIYTHTYTHAHAHHMHAHTHMHACARTHTQNNLSVELDITELILPFHSESSVHSSDINISYCEKYQKW